MPLDKDLIEILVCPLCKVPVRHAVEGASEWLDCPQCSRRYPVKDGIPVMLVDEAVLPSGGGSAAGAGRGP